MSIDLLHTDSDTTQFDDWLAQSVAESEVPTYVEDPESVGRLALLLALTPRDLPADQIGSAAA